MVGAAAALDVLDVGADGVVFPAWPSSPVLARLPADLLDRLDVSIADGDFQIEVGLRREPAEHELERLNEVFVTANAEFRRRLG
ncbi:hypothetical protein ODJ79_34925 [Actinoplanes sp. KI2]|uniref:hypothetical protein n=1 Tax=Actinoplanes sp. KI2 TaxID=2983315 RepID=UPI0021D5CC62|nr:hypothetical protein [Actinoplanes sp. KI2]MCU7728935.1 hypothetical protein [Actinoplanes sp. KI2]